MTSTLALSKQYALRAWSSNEHYNADFDFGIVTLTPELANTILARQARFTAVIALEPNLTQMEYWDGSCEYRAERDLEIASELEDGNAEWFTSIENGAEVGVLPGITLEDKGRDFSTECDRMIVLEDGVKWSCYPRHCSFTVETATLSWDEVRAVLEVKA